MTVEQAIEKVGKLTEELASAKSEIATLRDANKEKEKQIETAKTKRDEAAKELDELKKSLPDKDSVILSKSDHSSLEEKAKAIDGLNAKIKSLENRETVRDYAGKYNAAALIAHTPDTGTWEVYTTKVDGKDTKALRLIESSDGKEIKTNLDDFVKKVSEDRFVDFNTEPKRTVIEQKGAVRPASPESTGKAFGETMPNPF